MTAGPVFIFDLPNASNSSKLSDTTQCTLTSSALCVALSIALFNTFEARGGSNLGPKDRV